MTPRFLISILGLLLFFERAFAGENVSIPSQDKRHVLVFSGPNRMLPETFTIQDARGTVIVSSRDLPGLRDINFFHPSDALWSPNSQILAVAGGYSKNCYTFIFVRQGNGFAPVGVPDLTGILDNPYITPTKWLKDGRLVLAISGPHAGKARDYFYKGVATVRISVSPPHCEVLSNKIRDHQPTRLKPVSER